MKHVHVHAGYDNNLLSLANKSQVNGSEKGSASSSEKGSAGSDKPQDVIQSILSAIRHNPKVSAAEIAMKVGLSSRAIEKRIKTMRENGFIRRVGPDRGGYWEIIEK